MEDGNNNPASEWTVTVIERKKNEMTLRQASVSDTGAIWDYQCEFNGVDTFEIKRVVRQKADANAQSPPSVEGITGSGQAGIERLELKIVWPALGNVQHHFVGRRQSAPEAVTQSSSDATSQRESKSEEQSVLDVSNKMSDVFRKDAVYQGTWRNFRVGDDVANDVSDLTVIVRNRVQQDFRATWLLHKWNGEWIVEGSVVSNTSPAYSLQGVFTDLVGRSHPNENKNKLVATFSPDGTQLFGTVNYDAGGRSVGSKELNNSVSGE
jgi:hypothetical protein